MDAMGARNSKLPLFQTQLLQNCKQRGQKDHPFPSGWPGHFRTYRVQTQDKERRKAYILLIACSVTKAVHLQLLPNQTAEKIIKHLKPFITRKGHQRKIHTYNGRNFVAAAKWLNGVVKHVPFICFSQSRMFLWIQSYVKLDVSSKLNKLS